MEGTETGLGVRVPVWGNNWFLLGGGGGVIGLGTHTRVLVLGTWGGTGGSGRVAVGDSGRG